MKPALPLVAIALCSLSINACTPPTASNDAAPDATDSAADLDATDARDTALPEVLPPLGIYEVNVDGTGLELLADTGSQEITHVRRSPSSDWMAGTRYTDDADNNGLAMELENPYGAHYLAAQIVLFRESDPADVTVVAGGEAGKLCANASWTDDGALIYVHQDDPSNAMATRLKRAHFGSLPTVSSIDAVVLPAEFVLPSDPHQFGASDPTGAIVFPAFVHDASGWSHGVWRVSADGTSAFANATLVGCPLCGTMCCTWPTPGEVLGATDPRVNHAGTAVFWMQQSPSVSFGSPPVHPFRQVSRSLSGGTQSDVSSPGIASTTSETFIEWRDDDGEGVYWTIEVEGGVLRQNLYRMNPDGSARARIELPNDLCAFHPSYVAHDRIVFTAWRCAGTECSCDVARLTH